MVTQALQVIGRATVLLDMETSGAKLEQIVDKAEHVVTFMRKGQEAKIKVIKETLTITTWERLRRRQDI